MRQREANNDIKPAIPYVFLFDDGGGQTINGSYITWDTTKVLTHHFLYTSDTDRVFLTTNSAGLYEIKFEISLSGSGVNYFEIYKNGSIVNGSRVYVCSFIDGQDYYYMSGVLSFTLYLERNDYIQIKGVNVAGTGETIADCSRLFVKFLPMQGWDNGTSAGRTQYTGEVMR